MFARAAITPLIPGATTLPVALRPEKLPRFLRTAPDCSMGWQDFAPAPSETTVPRRTPGDTIWHARRYHYADGVAYKPNHYFVFDENDERIGGALKVANDRFLAFVGPCGPNEGLSYILATAETVSYGPDLKTALGNLKVKHLRPGSTQP